MEVKRLNINRLVIKLLAVISLSLWCSVAIAQRQTIEAITAERQKAEAEIARIDKRLKSLKSSEKDISEQLKLTVTRLNKRREVLRSIDAQISILGDRARSQSSLATEHQAKLEAMQAIYQINLGKLHQINNIHPSSGTLSRANSKERQIHFKHMARVLNSTILKQSAEINSIKGELGVELRDIKIRQTQLAILKVDEGDAVAQIALERKEIERLGSSIDKDQKQLSTQKATKQKSVDALQKRIEEIIRSEMSSKTPSGYKSLTPAQSEPISRAFAAAKGKMINPLGGGALISSFGVHNHPTQSGVKINNNGINLRGKPNSTVRLIASGEVRKVFVVPSMGASVLVRHGGYITVYSNLASVNVNQGDRVEAGMSLGKVGDDGTLHFEIWRETTALNPSGWISF